MSGAPPPPTVICEAASSPMRFTSPVADGVPAEGLFGVHANAVALGTAHLIDMSAVVVEL